MKVSGHHHALVALTLVPTEQEAEWAQGPVQMLCKNGELLASARN